LLRPGVSRSRLAQLPGIQANAKELESQREDFVEVLDMRGNDRVGDIRKASQGLDSVDASFKGAQFCCVKEIDRLMDLVIGERVITPSAIVFLVVELRASPPLDDRISESSSNVKDTNGTMEIDEEIDNKFLTGPNNVCQNVSGSIELRIVHMESLFDTRRLRW
jgi:translocation protein SEC63